MKAVLETILARVPGWSEADIRRGKLRVMAVGGGLAVLVSAFRAPPIKHDPHALADALRAREGIVVDPAEMFWEPRTGFLDELIWGRPLLYLGRKELGAPRDVYRTFVRLSYEGTPLSLRASYNLTNTDLGDDHGLTVRGARAVFATHAFGQEQSVTLLDMSSDHAFQTESSEVGASNGEGSENRSNQARSTKWMNTITAWQQTGRLRGLSRMDVTFDDSISRADLDFKNDAVARLRLKSGGRERALYTDEIDKPGSMAHAVVQLPPQKILVHWAVDTVRAISFIGPKPIAWLEEKAFAARDAKNRMMFRKRAGGDELAQKVEDLPPPISASKDPEAESFPPPALRSQWKTPEPGEGEWKTPETTFLKRAPKVGNAPEPPPAFARTFVRPDEERPYAKVLLVAMDMRQLDLEMEAGVEDPKPLTGPPGSGKIPRDPHVYKRVAAAFNGGFKTEHGNYGMMVKRRVLLPPVPGAASVIVTKDGRVGMGSWGAATKTPLAGIPDESVLYMRQNLEALLDNGVVNPTGRTLWGFTLPGTTMQTERSGICVTEPGHLIYAWGDDVSAITLGKAMKIAGCNYGMHLDMNPHHTGLVFTNVNELKGKNYKSELLSKQMEISPERFLEYSPKDFFYLLLREPGPPAFSGLSYHMDEGSQPAPKWLPGIYRADSGTIALRAFEADRFKIVLRSSRDGSDASGQLPDDVAKHVHFALALGDANERRGAGLRVSGSTATELKKDGTFLVLVAADTGASLVDAKELTDTASDFVELPALVLGGKRIDAVASLGPGSRVALGTTPERRMMVASSTHASPNDLADLLIKAGCDRAVLVERGAQHNAEIFRTGTPSPPRVRYKGTSLSFASMVPTPRTFKFTATQPFEFKKKK
jgi:hypothetical protein